MDITHYLNNEYSDSALYMSYRAIPSYIDGLKNSHRKIAYTLRKKNIKNELKVYQLASQVAMESNYIHGDTSLQGAIVTLAQDYTGANNLPFIKGEGNFGTRFLNEASAARYISARPQSYFDNIFKKEDDINLISQNFEGDEIEPRFYVPTLPLILINGSTGIGVGFSTKILNRSVENMKKAILAKLDNKRILSKWFIPSWNGFTGDVISLGDNKWDIRGTLTVNGRKAHITELPIGCSLTEYFTVLKKLKEKGLITKFVDNSEMDRFDFEVTLSDEESKKPFEEIFNDLKLSVVVTENLTCIDENNAIREFESIEELFNAYFNIKKDYLNKRLLSEIERLTQEASNLEEVHKFITEVIKGTLNLKKKKAELEKDMTSKGYVNIDKLLSLPLSSLTVEKSLEIKKRWEDKVAELEEMKKKDFKTLWEEDLKWL